jgi:hypothetical protein
MEPNIKEYSLKTIYGARHEAVDPIDRQMFVVSAYLRLKVHPAWFAERKQVTEQSPGTLCVRVTEIIKGLCVD